MTKISFRVRKMDFYKGNNWMFCVSSKSQIITNFYNKENKIQRTSICPHEYNFFKRMKIKV